MSLIDLPFETLHLIAVEAADHNPADLASLALVNKQCFAVCRPLINALPYHEIQIYLHWGHNKTTTPTTSAIEKLIKLLNDTDSMSHFRRIRIDSQEGDYRTTEDHPHYEWNPPKITDLKRKNPFESNDAMDGIFDYISSDYYEYPRLGGPMLGGIDLPVLSDEDRSTPGREMEESRAWNLIFTLVEKLPRLEDIFCLALDPPPPAFLDMLHSQKPRCRLHLHALVVVNKSTDRLPLSGLYDRRLLTSPLLYSVVLSDDCLDEIGFHRVSDKQVEVSEFPVGAEIIQALRQAPNLSHVYVRPTVKYMYHAAPSNLTSFRMKPLRYSEPRALTELHFNDLFEMHWRTINGWQIQFDFSRIEVLRLHQPLHDGDDDEDDDFQFLLSFRDSICRDQTFRSLKVLELQLGCNTDHRHGEGKFYAVIQQYIENLFPLRELILEQWGKMISLQSIVQAHGSTLRKLSLTYKWKSHDLCCLSESDVNLIASQCPLLEDLSCKVRRTHGNSLEVAIYRALGKIRRLRYLSLELAASYCSMSDRIVAYCYGARRYVPLEERSLCWRHQTITDGCAECNSRPTTGHSSGFDDFDSQECLWAGPTHPKSLNGYIKQFMIDSALDKELACAIFREIAASKPRNSLRLEAMNIRIDEAPTNCIFPTSWRVESRLRFLAPDEVIAWEIDLDEMNDLASRQKPLIPEWERVFKRIWPDNDSDAGKHTGSAAANGTSDSDFSRTSSHDARKEHGDRNWWMKWSSFPLCSE